MSDTINITTTILEEVVEITTTDNQTIVNVINQSGGTNITKTSDITNDGAGGTSTYVETDELATVATTGSYNDLNDLPTILNNYKKFVEWSTGNSRSISVSEGVQVKNVFINETLIYSTADSSTYGKWSQASPGANVVISADVLFDDQSRILITN